MGMCWSRNETRIFLSEWRKSWSKVIHTVIALLFAVEKVVFVFSD
jgi:hypothetical protein